MHRSKKVAFALVYTIVYVILAFLSTGAGHGSYIALIPLIPWFLMLVAFYFLGKFESQLNRILFVMLMFTHFLLIAILLIKFPFPEEYRFDSLSWLPPAVWYLIGQFLLWMLFISERSIVKSEENL